jgi:pyruvate/2-oxoglutarate dehydrogenase complex dihydrolipoamide dehydrogenase (E3) component
MNVSTTTDVKDYGLIILGGGTGGTVAAWTFAAQRRLELDVVPSHLIVLGSGYVGLEFAQAMRRFGSRVTVLGRDSRLLSGEDEDVGEALQRLLEDEEVDLILNATVKRISGKSGECVRILLETNGNGAKKTVEGSHLLAATGRTPNTQGIGLELAGVELNDSGYIKVNEHLETSAPGIWAIGEVAGSPQFTHVSVDDFRVVHDSITGGKRVTTGRQIPFCLFTDPEFARIGLNGKKAKEQGVGYRLFRIPMEAVMRASTVSETRGFLKALVETSCDCILGFTAVGVGAAEIMTTVQIAMEAGLPFATLRDTILTHPALTEGLIALFSSTPSTSESAGEDDRRIGR